MDRLGLLHFRVVGFLLSIPKGTIVQMGPSAKRLSVTRKFALPLNHRKSIGKPKSPRLWQTKSSLLAKEETPDYW